MRGRKGQPAEIKTAKGNPGKRPVKAASTEDLPELKGGAPRELTKEGKEVWRQIAPKLSHSKLLRETDRGVLMRYCDTVAQYWKATRKLRRGKAEVYEAPMTNGGKMLRINPWFSVQERLGNRLEKMEDRLGLSPRARQELMFRLASVPAVPPSDLFQGGAEQETKSNPAPRGPVGILKGPVAGHA